MRLTSKIISVLSLSPSIFFESHYACQSKCHQELYTAENHAQMSIFQTLSSWFFVISSFASWRRVLVLSKCSCRNLRKSTIVFFCISCHSCVASAYSFFVVKFNHIICMTVRKLRQILLFRLQQSFIF